MNEIRFWRTSDDYGCLSNFSRYPVEINGEYYQTTEHYYQSQKTSDPSLREFVRQADTPKEAKRRVRQFPDAFRTDWEDVKESIMMLALRAKTDQHPLIRSKLLASGQARLIEASPFDSYWGEGKDRQGKNRLGELWMQLRREIRGN